MTGMVSYLLALAVGVVCLAGFSSATVCYSCFSTDSGTCSYPFNPTASGVTNVTCSGQCSTQRAGILTSSSFSGTYNRGCSSGNSSTNGCSGLGSAVVCNMVCNTDFCNNQNHGSAGPTPVGAYMFSALLLVTMATIKTLAI